MNENLQIELLSQNLSANASNNWTSSLHGMARPAYFGTLKVVEQVLMTTLVVGIMAAAGCAVEPAVMWRHLKRPKGVCIGVSSQFGLLPLSAFGLAHALGVTAPHAIAMVMLASCPGGAMSNLYSIWCAGDVSLSIVMTTCSTVLALGMMPLCVWVYSASWTERLTAPIPYLNIIISLLLMLVPVSVGILIKRYRRKWAKIVLKCGSVCGGLGIATSIIITCLLYPSIFNSSWTVYVSGLILPAVGLTLGYTMATLFCMPPICRRTVSLETGCQNIPLAFTLVILSFRDEWIPHMVPFILIYGVSSLVEMALMTGICRLIDKWGSVNESGDAPETEIVDVGTFKDITGLGSAKDVVTIVTVRKDQYECIINDINT